MREMCAEDRKDIERKITDTMLHAVSSDYVRYILEEKDGWSGNTFMEDVIDDVMCSSAWDEEGYYNFDDIRLSIGRILMERLGIEV